MQKTDTNSYNRSYGERGSYSTNWQLHGREILDSAEVRMLDNRYAILFIRGESAVKDLKYDIMSHINVSLTEDGGADAYMHGKEADAKATIAFEYLGKSESEDTVETEEECAYELISEVELLEMIERKAEKKDEKTVNT